MYKRDITLNAYQGGTGNDVYLSRGNVRGGADVYLRVVPTGNDIFSYRQQYNIAEAVAAGTLFDQALDAVAIGVATLTTALSFQVSMAATAIGAATLTVTLRIQQTLTSVGVGIANLTTLFIPGVGGAANLLNIVVKRVRWRRY